MKSFSFARALTAGCLLCLALPIACGDDDDAAPSNTGGTGGTNVGGEPASLGGGGMSEAGAGGAAAALPAGISSTSKTVACGAAMCDSASVMGAGLFIDPCCDASTCGLETGFLELVGASFADKCQTKGQVGEVDDNCPTTPASTIPFKLGGKTVMVPIDGFVGCCRENGKCGVVVDDVNSKALGNITTLGLGCVDAAPFFPGQTPASCGAGGGSTGGAGGGGGVGGAGGGDTSTPGGTGGAGGNP